MPLTQDQEDDEYERRMDQTAVNIEKMRNDIKYEGRKFAVQVVIGAAACVGAGIVIANYVNSRPVPPPAPQPVYLVTPPGIPKQG